MPNVFEEMDKTFQKSGELQLPVPAEEQNVFAALETQQQNPQFDAPPGAAPVRPAQAGMVGTQPGPSAAPATTAEDPNEIVKRGTILPAGRTRSGALVPALPEFLEGPRQTIMGILDGKILANEITGKQAFELGALFAPSAGTMPGGAMATAAPKAGAKVAEAAAAPKAAADALTPATVEAAAFKEVLKEVSNKINKEVPSVEKLRGLSKDLFEAAENANVVIAGPKAVQIATDMAKAAIDKPIHGKIHKEVSAALKTLVADVTAGDEIALKALDRNRELLSGIARKAQDPRERELAGELLGIYDKGLQSLKPGDVVGDLAKSQEAIDATKLARELWKRQAKAEIIETMIDNAELKKGKFSGSGLENAIRTAFRGLATDKNKMRQFSPEEQAAIKKAATGGALATAARIIGKFSPESFFPIMAAIGAVGTKGLAGIALPAAGFAGRRLANSIAERQAEAVSTLIRSGGGKSRFELPQRTLQQMEE